MLTRGSFGCIVVGNNEGKVDSQKKIRREDSGDLLEAFYDRLCDLCESDVACVEGDRTSIAENESQFTVTIARESGILIETEESWEEFRLASKADVHFASEHAVDLDIDEQRMVKVTIPPKFGLVPLVMCHPVINLRDDPAFPKFQKAIEFGPGTAREYLRRWIIANDVFQDDVRLASVIKWADNKVSFCITQPHYDGESANEAEIERYFVKANWTRIKDPTHQHRIFFNYAYDVLAIDAMPRNCYLNEAGLQPFDVILVEPDEELEKFLNIYG